jgi:hypothetical protein
MNKTLNIFAIILFVSFVNTTKLVSYSDVVSSLLQLNDDPNVGLSNLNTIAEEFAASNKLLTDLKTITTENCSKVNSRSAERLENIKGQIESFNQDINRLRDVIAKINSEATYDEGAVKDEVEKIKKANADIKVAKQSAIEKEQAILETIQVLKRLKNLAQDELLGMQQKTTEITKFNVTITTSFIQMNSFTEQLKSVMGKSETASKSLISTLILLVQSAGKQTYSNPETVRKILDLLDRIIADNQTKNRTNDQELLDSVKQYDSIINNSKELIARIREDIAKKLNDKSAAESNILMQQNDILFLQKAIARREKRNKFTSDICSGQASLIERHFAQYEKTLNHVNVLKSQLTGN